MHFNVSRKSIGRDSIYEAGHKSTNKSNSINQFDVHRYMIYLFPIEYKFSREKKRNITFRLIFFLILIVDFI